ncbi:MAG: hypothetical protein ATN35_12550 [Epulopiscium sp. Nele67-Bin004]|nr:MAG: hypothetical protein ATN35_12550 [Epulopiscium sp. Nele67-Bin004]
MEFKKVKTHKLNKCYSISQIKHQGEERILVAAEKQDECFMFDLEGNLKDTIWEGPGGTMSMVRIPGVESKFLATHKFYSPNDSKESKIVVATHAGESWEIETLVDLPHVHRFDILTRNNVNYLFAATLCSGRDFKDDWAHKGMVHVATLPDNLGAYNEDNQLKLTVIKDQLLKNHGYFKGQENGYTYGVIGTEDGVFKFTPPADQNGEFEVKKLLDSPASDMTFVDFDNDGNLEMVVFSPFHGENLDVYKLKDGKYEHVYKYPKPFEFSHALWPINVDGKNVAILGHRQGGQELIALYNEDGEYKVQVIDSGVGPANVYSYMLGEQRYLVSANRETDEIAWYTVN